MSKTVADDLLKLGPLSWSEQNDRGTGFAGSKPRCSPNRSKEEVVSSRPENNDNPSAAEIAVGTQQQLASERETAGQACPAGLGKSRAGHGMAWAHGEALRGFRV